MFSCIVTCVHWAGAGLLEFSLFRTTRYHPSSESLCDPLAQTPHGEHSRSTHPRGASLLELTNASRSKFPVGSLPSPNASVGFMGVGSGWGWGWGINGVETSWVSALTDCVDGLGAIDL